VAYDAGETLAARVASTSDIDDVMPTLVAYQLEWNKLHVRLRANSQFQLPEYPGTPFADELGQYLEISPDDRNRLQRV
jgi:hypothetical protein